MGEGLDPRILEDCASEPIRTPGSIQPHGALLVLSGADGRVLHASANAGRLLGEEPAAVLGRPVPEDAPIAPTLAELAGRPRTLRHDMPQDGEGSAVRAAGRLWHVTCRPVRGTLLVEAEEIERPERVESLYGEVRGLGDKIQAASSIEGLAGLVARTVRELTGFDRALVYRFDEGWNGTVVAEDRNEELPSYLDLRFPASDIPAQARELYRTNRIRQIPDVDYVPVPVLAAPGIADSSVPLDLSEAALRSVSPVHLQYMRNMGTAASMSISIVVAGALWGLISCHNRAPRRASPGVRGACDFVGQMVAMRIAGHQLYVEAAERVSRQAVHARLLTAMAAAPRFLEGLTDASADLLRLVEAEGAAIVSDESCVSVGSVPEEPDIRRLVAWLDGRTANGVFATDALARILPELEPCRETASGVLAVAISQLHPSYVLWFRPEVVRTVRWGGDPRKPADATAGARLNPRRSFETWRETVHLTARPWRPGEVEAARDLRSAIINIVLRKAEQLADLSRELERSNKELEAFSYSVSHDLRAPFRHIVGYAELLRERMGGSLDEKCGHYLDTIIQSAFSAGQLVDDLLHFSQMGRVTLNKLPVSLDALLDDVLRISARDMDGRRIELRRGPLPGVSGDPALLRQVLQNLVDNAIKYTRGRDPAIIEVTGERRDGEVVVCVSDNGVGFDMAYVGKLFGVFQRLHRAEEFEGTGIGLANVRRIVERHGGRTWAEGASGQGARFFFSIPDQQPPGGQT